MIILSIIVPVYNVEKYIRKTMESIFDSSYPNNEVEVIVVNDGTKDNSMSIVNDFAIKFDNLKVINQENKGLSEARNTGLKIAQGKYVWFVDSDDWIERGFVSKILPLLKDCDENVYMMHMRIVNEKDCTERNSPFLNIEHPISIDGYKAIWLDARKKVKITPMQRYVIRRNFILDNSLFFIPGIYHEDVEYAPRMLVSTSRIIIIPWIGYCYLVRMSGSITTDKTKQIRRNESRVKIIGCFQELESKLKDKRKQKAICFSKYKAMTYLFNESSLEYFYKGMQTNDLSSWKYKKIVISHLFFDRKIMHLGRQLLFVISPKLLKLLHKKL